MCASVFYICIKINQCSVCCAPDLACVPVLWQLALLVFPPLCPGGRIIIYQYLAPGAPQACKQAPTPFICPCPTSRPPPPCPTSWPPPPPQPPFGWPPLPPESPKAIFTFSKSSSRQSWESVTDALWQILNSTLRRCGIVSVLVLNVLELYGFVWFCMITDSALRQSICGNSETS